MAGQAYGQIPALEFARAVGGAGQDNGYAIAIGLDKSVYVAGAFTGTVDFDPGPGDATRTSAGGEDVFVAKYDAAGNFLRVWTFGGAGIDQAYYLDVDAFGGFYVSGDFTGTADFDPGPATFNLTSAGEEDFFLVYVDGNGDLGYAYQWGTAFADYVGNVQADRYGNVYLAGSYNTDPMDADPTAGAFVLPNPHLAVQAFLVKIRFDGAFDYAISLNSPNDVYIDSITTDAYGNVFIITEFANTLDADPGPGVHNLSSPGVYSIGLIKLDPAGSFLEAAVLVRGLDGTSFGLPYNTDIDQHGNIYMTGLFMNTMDFDPGPGTLFYSAPINRSIFVMKLDRDYNLIYAHAFGDGNLTNGAHIFSNSAGAAYVVGRFSGTVDFDPGPGVTNLTAAGTGTPVVMNFEPDGSLGWAFTVEGCDNGAAFDLVLDRDNELYVSGAFVGTGDFDPGPGTLDYTSAGMRDIWFAHYGADIDVITTVDPYVADIVLSGNSGSLYTFDVTFSEDVTGVDIGDFTVNGTVGGTVTGLSGSGSAYEVTIDVSATGGVVFLDLIDNDSIVRMGAPDPLGGAGPFNGDYFDGEEAVVLNFGPEVPLVSGWMQAILAGVLGLLAIRMIPARRRA